MVQPKPKYTDVKKEELESQMIRLSIDMRIPNESMKRSRYVQSPGVEYFIYKLTLDSATRQVVTFSTPWGNYRPQRLVFGEKSSQDIFDDAMFRILGDIHTSLPAPGR